METAYLIVTMVVGVLAGGGMAYVLLRRAGAGGDSARLQQERDAALVDAQQQREGRVRAEAERDARVRELGEQRQRHEQDIRAVKELQAQALAEAQQQHARALQQLREAFAALSSETLKEAAPAFVRLADEKFRALLETAKGTLAQQSEAAKGDLAQRKTEIEGLLGPIRAQLEAYRTQLAESEAARSGAFGELRAQLETLSQQSTLLSAETAQFRSVLKSSQARGRWGEETLRRVVEAAGMSPHCDFVEQTGHDDGRPDLIVRLPGERTIVVDSKVPDLDIAAALNEADEVKRRDLLKAHADKLKKTISDLAARDYPGKVPGALELVVLFVPAESLFSAALEGDRDLLVWAAKQKITIATPASLIALLRAAAVSWQYYAQSENVQQIADNARVLYERLRTFCEHLEKIGKGLGTALGAYNEAVGSFQRSVLPQARRFEELGAAPPSAALGGPEPQTGSIREITVRE